MHSRIVGTRISVKEILEDNPLEDFSNIDTCTNCGIWWYKKDLIPDLDGNLIDKVCERFYGL